MKNYKALTTLNPDALLIGLYANGVITYEQRQVVDKTLPLSSQKMDYILNEVILPDLKIGETSKFKGFLQAMEESEDTTINKVGSRLGELIIPALQLGQIIQTIYRYIDCTIKVF